MRIEPTEFGPRDPLINLYMQFRDHRMPVIHSAIRLSTANDIIADEKDTLKMVRVEQSFA